MVDHILLLYLHCLKDVYSAHIFLFNLGRIGMEFNHNAIVLWMFIWNEFFLILKIIFQIWEYAKVTFIASWRQAFLYRKASNSQFRYCENCLLSFLFLLLTEYFLSFSLFHTACPNFFSFFLHSIFLLLNLYSIPNTFSLALILSLKETSSVGWFQAFTTTRQPQHCLTFLKSPTLILTMETESLLSWCFPQIATPYFYSRVFSCFLNELFFAIYQHQGYQKWLPSTSSHTDIHGCWQFVTV